MTMQNARLLLRRASSELLCLAAGAAGCQRLANSKELFLAPQPMRDGCGNFGFLDCEAERPRPGVSPSPDVRLIRSSARLGCELSGPGLAAIGSSGSVSVELVPPHDTGTVYGASAATASADGGAYLTEHVMALLEPQPGRVVATL